MGRLAPFLGTSIGFYNGVTEDQIADEANPRNGIHHWARRGIAGRGVLIDFQRFAAAHDISFNPGERYGIAPEQLQAAADWRRPALKRADPDAAHGMDRMVLRFERRQRSQIAQPGALQIAGLEQGEDSLRSPGTITSPRLPATIRLLRLYRPPLPTRTITRE